MACPQHGGSPRAVEEWRRDDGSAGWRRTRWHDPLPREPALVLDHRAGLDGLPPEDIAARTDPGCRVLAIRNVAPPPQTVAALCRLLPRLCVLEVSVGDDGTRNRCVRAAGEALGDRLRGLCGSKGYGQYDAGAGALSGIRGLCRWACVLRYPATQL